MKKPALARPWWLLPPGRLHPVWWFALSVVLLGVDYVTGLYSQLPSLYVIPVVLAAWYSGLWPALVVAIGTPLVHVALVLTRGTALEPLAPFVAVTLLRATIILVLALWFVRLSEHELELQRHVQTLEGLLHICSFCKKIRNKEGRWERLEKVISERSEARFTHGYCPACITIHYPEFANDDAAPQTSN